MSDLSDLRNVAAQDQSAALDDILSRWHHWRGGFKAVKGFSGGGNATNDYRCSRQYDDANGALDDQIEDNIMRQVEFQITELGSIHQAAIQANARALNCGAEVWSHPRLPQDPTERRKVIQEARAALTRRLVSAGVM